MAHVGSMEAKVIVVWWVTPELRAGQEMTVNRETPVILGRRDRPDTPDNRVTPDRPARRAEPAPQDSKELPGPRELLGRPGASVSRVSLVLRASPVKLDHAE